MPNNSENRNTNGSHIRSENCRYCNLINPNCHHLVYCSSTKVLWDALWIIVGRMGLEPSKKERMFGLDMILLHLHYSLHGFPGSGRKLQKISVQYK
jgi:hypothetical protein